MIGSYSFVLSRREMNSKHSCGSIVHVSVTLHMEIRLRVDGVDHICKFVVSVTTQRYILCLETNHSARDSDKV